MIHPIGNQLASSGLGLAAPITDRPAAQAKPATQVTPASEAQSDRFEKPADPRALGLRGSLQEPKSSLEKALESVNSSLQAWSTGLRFEMDEDAQRLVVSIIDSDSGDVVRTIPSDAVLRVAKLIVQLQGSGVDTEA